MVNCIDTEASLSSVATGKRFIVVAVLIYYIGYLAAVVIAHVMTHKPIGKRMKGVMNELSYKNAFFIIVAALYHVILPKWFPILLMYLYLLIVIAHVVMHGIDKI